MQPPYPDDRLYHHHALWLEYLADGEARLGVSHFAQRSLGNVVYVDLPRPGALLRQDAPFGTIESGKAVSDLIAPAGGVVLEVNAKLREDPALVNREPYAGGWLLRIRMDKADDRDGLLDAAGFMSYLGERA